MSELISVNIPAFNAEETILETLESLNKQTYQDIEVLICDDGSTDKTAQLVEDFIKSSPRFQLIKNKKNQGVSYGLNRLAGTSKGKYIATMSADDICHPDRIKDQVKFMEENPEIDISGAEIEVCRGSTIQPQNFHKLQKRHKDIAQQLKYCTAIHHVTMMAKSQVYKKISYSEDFPAAVDYDFLLKALSTGFRFANLDKPLVTYRVHDNAIGTKHRSKQLLGAYIANRLFKKGDNLSANKASFHSFQSNLNYMAKLFLEKSSALREDNITNKLVRLVIAPFSAIGRFYLKRKLALRFLF
jgi:glycosyltransferase involved in cell wall biosynthesis